MQFLKIGHYTNEKDKTGLTVFLFEHPAVAAYQLCGSSPASRDLHILDFEANVNEINGLLLTGGSAYGLGATNGVMQYLQEQGIGRRFRNCIVPLVPTAGIFDLAIGENSAPAPENAYAACLLANENPVEQGLKGAGTGASVGKLIPGTQWMQGGFGHAETQLTGGLVIEVYAVVNALGDIRNATGEIIAGAKQPNGEFANCEFYFSSGQCEEALFPRENTVLIACFTNAKFNRIELKRIAKMATAGIARAVYPAFTRADGDIVFCVSLGELNANELTVGVTAAELTRQAIVNAVKKSEIIELFR